MASEIGDASCASRLFSPPLWLGRFPGSANVPWARAVDAAGTLKSKGEPKKLYAEAGIDGSKPVITPCRIRHGRGGRERKGR